MSLQESVVKDVPAFKPEAAVTNSYDKAIAELEITINRQYFKIDRDSKFIVHQGVVDPNEDTSMLAEKLQRTNYEIAALKGEFIILFKSPYFVSKVVCNELLRPTSKGNALRIISSRFVERKVATSTKDEWRSGGLGRFPIYDINETIYGLILPKNLHLDYAFAIEFETYFGDEQRANSIIEANKEVALEANILTKTLTTKVNEVNEFLEEQMLVYKSHTENMEAILKEQDRVENSIGTSKDTLARIKSDIEKVTNEYETKLTQRDNLLGSYEQLVLEVEARKNQINTSKEEYHGVVSLLDEGRDELSALRDELASVKADINVTTLDMKGFSNETKSQLSIYFKLTMVAIFFLASVFIHLYTNAQSLIDLIKDAPNVSVWNILLSRLPLVTATTLIIGTLSALLFYLVNNIISVNDGKMKMLKASILAEQITGSLPKQGMSDEEIRDYKRNTKIELVTSIFTGENNKVQVDNQQSLLKQFAELVELIKKG
ncbi:MULTISPECIES: hypothetical protein [unclassified Shewanella]|uniref:hypothetical protein n=1 Tax=unclassified Shewanella TaxID=196818 RepID=UPI001BC21E96|nr:MULTISPECIES: hypothetical protein [unclassified Shewanella]GIU10550.1 hypothetical protein TUM4444_15040 [Shewanella sp. MBTL60-112-B1]GIU35068.1 hypothetical protein TUM4445_24420 [Shewanella sp. MBTL60-112-B2]